MFKKCLSFILVLMLITSAFAALTTSVSAAEDQVAAEGAEADVADTSVKITSKVENDKPINLKVGQAIIFKSGIERPNGTTSVYQHYEMEAIKSEALCEDGEKRSVDYILSWSANYITNSDTLFRIEALRPGKATIQFLITYRDTEFNVYVQDIINCDILILGENGISTPRVKHCESLDSGVRITWNAVFGAERYRVYYYGSKGWTYMGSTTSTSFVDTDVTSGGTYRYTVRCVNAANTQFTSDFDSTGFRYTYNLTTPRITSMSSTASGVKINWSKVPNASRYRVYYKNSKGGWTKMAELTGTNYTDSDVRFGGNYTYTVRCVNASGRFTSDFNSTGWKHTHYLPTPVITGFESVSEGVKIKWNAVSGAQKYRVYYRNSKGGWTKMGETSGSSFVDTDVRKGSSYTYTVRCINNSLNTFMSDCNTSGWRYTYNPQFDTPHITSCEIADGGIAVSWGAVEGATRYAVYHKTTGSWKRIAETTDTHYLDTDVTDGTAYTYTIRCLTDNGKDFASDFDRAGATAVYHVAQEPTAAVS